MEMTINNGRELSLGRPKGGRLVDFKLPFFSTIISGIFITGRLICDRLEMQVQLRFAKQCWYILETPRRPAGGKKMKTYVRFQHVYFGNRNFSWNERVFVVHSYHGRKQRVQFSFFLFAELTNQDVTKYSGQFLYAFVPKKWTTIVTNI